MRQRDGHWWVYLLRCADGSIYAGATNDLQRRLAAHARGRVKYTRGRRPVEMAFAEPQRGKGRALSREAELKRLPRGLKLALVGSDPKCDSSHLQPAGTEE